MTASSRLVMIIKAKRAEIARLIVEHRNWHNIGLYFEDKYHFVVSEAYLKAKCGEHKTPLYLCEQLIEELASRGVLIEAFVNALLDANIGMNSVANYVTSIASNNEYLCTFFLL